MPELGDYLTTINYTKQSLMEDPETLEENERGYLPYIINRLLSNFPDAIFQANEMNRFPLTDKRLQYDYLLNILRQRKRFSKFLKPENIEDLDVVKEYFCYNTQKAKEALKILTKDNIDYIKSKLFKGGRKK